MSTETNEIKQTQKSVDEKADELLAHPVKKAILELLYEKEGCFFGDIVEALPFTYGEILDNLLELKRAGVVIKKSDPSHFVVA
jgi:hypothetical protein